MYAAVLAEGVNADLCESSGILSFYQIISFALQEDFTYLQSKAIGFSRYFFVKLPSCTSTWQVFLYTEYSKFKNKDVLKGS